MNLLMSIFFLAGKPGTPNFVARHNRLDSESMSDKDRDWSQEDTRKDRDNDKWVSSIKLQLCLFILDN